MPGKESVAQGRGDFLQQFQPRQGDFHLGRRGGHRLGSTDRPQHDHRHGHSTSTQRLGLGPAVHSQQICPTGAWKLSNVVDRPIEPIGNEYQENLTARGAIYSAFAQAVPNVPVIDREACAHFLTGECGLCDRAVQFILRHDNRRKSLRFAALQGETAAPILARHGLTPPKGRGWDSMVYVEDPGGPGETTSLRSRAALQIGRYLGGRWKALARFGSLAPSALGDGAYRLVARARHRLHRATQR